MEPIPLDPVDSLTSRRWSTTSPTWLMVDEGPPAASAVARRYPSVPARFLEGDDTGDPLRAEHGFSCLVTIAKADQTTKILFDAGVTPDGLVENMRRLELSPRDIDIIVLSHGHWDHTTGMDGLVSRARARATCPV